MTISLLLHIVKYPRERLPFFFTSFPCSDTQANMIETTNMNVGYFSNEYSTHMWGISTNALVWILCVIGNFTRIHWRNILKVDYFSNNYFVAKTPKMEGDPGKKAPLQP